MSISSSNKSLCLFNNIESIINNTNISNIIRKDEEYNKIHTICMELNSKIIEKRYKSNQQSSFRNQTYKTNRYTRNYIDSNNTSKPNYDTETSNKYNKKYSKYNNYNTYNNNSLKLQNNTNNNTVEKNSNNSSIQYTNDKKQGSNFELSENVLLSLNKNLNIISIKNYDIVYGNVLETIGMYIVNKFTSYMDNYNKFVLKFKSDDSMIQNMDFKELQNDIDNFINYITLICLKKALIDFSNFNNYFKFINSLLKNNINNFKANIFKRVYQYVNNLINTNTNFMNDDNKEFIESVNNRLKKKTDTLINAFSIIKLFNYGIGEFINSINIASVNFLKNTRDTTETDEPDALRTFIENNVKYINKGKESNLSLHTFTNDILYQLIGYFNKYFNNFQKGANNKYFTDYLIGIYDNFKRINELLIWEPINTLELENRIYFTIGFLHNNTHFIKILDYDLYQDIESELETIKKSNNIPVSVKYKLLDTIDNFIQNRLS
jgi:hypothetical protein